MDVNNIMSKGSIFILIISFVFIAISGLFFGVTYFFMDNINTAFLSADCTIDNNTMVSSCQELWEMSLYPFLALKEILIWASFIAIFALAAGLLVFGYQSGTRPTLLGFLVIVEILMVYGSLHMANIYRVLIENDIIRGMLSDFTVYNRIMLNFPWFVFIISLFSIALGIVNWQRVNVNNPKNELDY